MKHIPQILIKPIDHDKQRYPTVGDWVIEPDDGSITIRVSRMKDWRYEAAVALHEIIESLDCIDKEISQEAVDEFDKGFERLRNEYPDFIGNTEPGDMETAPYHSSHRFATDIETNYIFGNGLAWKEYSDYVNKL